MISNTNIQQVIAYSIAFIVLGLTTGSLGPALPTLAGQTSVTLSTIGFLFTARSLGFMLGSFQGGKLIDRVSGHQLVAVAIFLMSLMMFATPLSLWFVTLFFVMLILGTAEGTLDVSCNMLLVWTHGKRVAPYLNGVHFFYGVGAFLSPIIIAKLSFAGYKTAFWLLSLLIVPGALLLLRLPSPQRRENSKTVSEPTATNTRTIIFIAFVFFLYLGAEVSFGGWIYTYAVTLKLGTETEAAYLTSFFWGALTIGRLVSIPLARKFLPDQLLLVDLIGCVLSVGLIVIQPTSRAAVWCGTIGLGLSMASFFPTMFSFAERKVLLTGKIAGRILVGASAGAMLLPWLVGHVFAQMGPQSAMYLIALDLLITLIAFVLLINLTKPLGRKTASDGEKGLCETECLINQPQV